MYIVKDYLTDQTVAVVTRKEDAIALMQGSNRADDPKLIVEKKWMISMAYAKSLFSNISFFLTFQSTCTILSV